jgi:murein DD-endopeptidase MepM/ murein hydrolase activator NlpD
MKFSFRPVVKIWLAALLAIGLIGPMLVIAQENPATPEAVAPDTTSPVLSQPGELVAAAADAGGAVVTYDAPAASDETDGPLGVNCAPASGSLFPLGRSLVTCSATDSSGNYAEVVFPITVLDQSAPVINQPADIVLTTIDPNGLAVTFDLPAATDAVDGPVGAWCDVESGALLPVGTTVITCSAQDGAANVASVSFSVTVVLDEAPTETPATEEPSTETPEATATPEATPDPDATPAPGDGSPTAEPTVPGDGSTDPSATPADPSATPTGTATPTGPTPEPVISTAEEAPSVDLPDTAEQHRASAGDVDGATREVRAALELPSVAPPALDLDYGGPVTGLSLIWGYLDFPLSQEFGHTEFSISHASWYNYGTAYGLDGYEHPGLDIGMPAGTQLYSPVSGAVKIAGGVPYFTFYGNGQRGVGELLIVTDSGDEVVLGHMGRIAVTEGQRVEVGDFVGLSGGDNGDHLHLEVRQWTGGGMRIVDPRQSILLDSIAAALGVDLGSTTTRIWRQFGPFSIESI